VNQFLDEVLAFVPTLIVGDPLDPRTDIGTWWIRGGLPRRELGARGGGAGGQVLCGGTRQGAQMAPRGDQRDPSMRIVCEEVFGPVVAVVPYRDLTDAVRQVNDSRYGLQCGVYSRSWRWRSGPSGRSGRAGSSSTDLDLADRPDALRRGQAERDRSRGPRYAIER
jgi:acyl-CoA reductase-like NAD-dependent aldehyde dehydrogenase